MPTKILYLTIDGLTEPLGQSQILSYQQRISGKDFQITICSFEKSDTLQARKNIIENICRAAGIQWIYFPYRSKPPVIGTIIGLIEAFLGIRKVIKKESKFDIVHCRGNITPLLGLVLRLFYHTPFIFDMRGWGADEKMESGHWKRWYFIPVFHFFKYMECVFFAKSKSIVSLTYAGQTEIAKQNYAPKEKVDVIPTCVDFDIFKEFSLDIRNQIRIKWNIPLEAKVLVYSGSLGGNYPTGKILLFFKAFLAVQPSAHFIILSKYPGANLDEECRKMELPIDRIHLTSVPLDQVYQYLHAADIGMVLYERTYSAIGRSPTKMGEYWSAGLPTISLSGIGDLDYIKGLYPNNLYLINEVAFENLKTAFTEIQSKEIQKEQLRTDAKVYFGVEKGVEFYKNLYLKVLRS